jgi:tetratricopeptide (TPR) repeat protein
MTADEAVETSNTISGGILFGPALQGHHIRATFHLPAAAPKALAQLPAETPAFTGRDDDLAILAGLLKPGGDARPVLVSAVAGLAGVGKTTLAVQAGHAAMRNGWFKGGVLFIDLHGYDDQPVEHAQALDALLRALGVPAEHVPAAAEDRVGLYRSVLAQMSEPVLVVADNASTEAQVRPLLPGAGPHKVLVTSRDTLAGLGARLLEVTVLGKEESVDLLDSALRAARPDDERISGDPDAARKLAWLCGGLPLALQITAALLIADPALSVSELWGELSEDRRVERFRYDDNTGSPTASVAAAFDLSYARLDDGAKRVFQMVPVIPGPDFSTEAAAIVADLPVRAVRKLLGGLARAHLMEPAPAVPGRWRRHDLVRLYATQRSDAQTDRRDRALDRLLRHWLDTVIEVESQLRAPPGRQVSSRFTGLSDALTWVDGERASLITAVHVAAVTGRDEPAMLLGLRLADYLERRRRFDDWIAVAEVSAHAARRLADRQRESEGFGLLGCALAGVARYDDAVAAHKQDLNISRQIGSRFGEGRALCNLGSALYGAERALRRAGHRNGREHSLASANALDDANTLINDSVTVFREVGDEHRAANALGNLGIVLDEAGRYEQAVTAHRTALSIFREFSDRRAEAMALSNLGMSLSQAGRYDEAIGVLKDAVAVLRSTGDRYGEGSALGNLGVAMVRADRYSEAIIVHKEGLAIFREIGDRLLECRILGNLASAPGGCGPIRRCHLRTPASPGNLP